MRRAERGLSIEEKSAVDLGAAKRKVLRSRGRAIRPGRASHLAFVRVHQDATERGEQ